jgi:hypothetical protein
MASVLSVVVSFKSEKGDKLTGSMPAFSRRLHLLKAFLIKLTGVIGNAAKIMSEYIPCVPIAEIGLLR